MVSGHRPQHDIRESLKGSTHDMKLTHISDYDIVNYKKISMFLSTYKCTMKCGQECQNKELLEYAVKDIPNSLIVKSFVANPLTEAVVIGGLEPLDDVEDVFEFIKDFRKYCDNDIVIYTGYTEEEVSATVLALKCFKNIIIKFGRYIPRTNKRFDEVLGVTLASKNQYAVRIS